MTNWFKLAPAVIALAATAALVMLSEASPLYV